MKQTRERQTKGAAFAILSVAIFVLHTSFYSSLPDVAHGAATAGAETSDDARVSAQAFVRASVVLFNPRCVNCHPAKDSPLVGDRGRLHPMGVVRGPEGMGKNGLWCSTCHQDRNLQGAHMPPGAPGWQLPPADTPMVFEKKTSGELCRQLKDPAQNGGRDPAEVVEHVREAPLVRWAWSPGEGRAAVPVSHEQFVKDMTEWARNGAACPE